MYRSLLLYSNSHNIGLSIDYPTIALHAIQSTPAPSSTEPSSQGIYMQLIPDTPNTSTSEDEEPPETVSMIIIPTACASPPSAAPTANGDDTLTTEDEPSQTPAQAFFTALSDCSNLHPDPAIDGEDGEGGLMQSGLITMGSSDGSLPPPMPGSGGWITAENMHEFVDEDGNLIMEDDDDDDDDEMGEDGDDGEQQQQLGPGAGTVRARPGDHEGDGKDGEAGEAKWQRTA